MPASSDLTVADKVNDWIAIVVNRASSPAVCDRTRGEPAEGSPVGVAARTNSRARTPAMAD
jgi:hypothetical protein